MRFVSRLPFLALLFFALPGRQAQKATDQPLPLPVTKKAGVAGGSALTKKDQEE